MVPLLPMRIFVAGWRLAAAVDALLAGIREMTPRRHIDELPAAL